MHTPVVIIEDWYHNFILGPVTRLLKRHFRGILENLLGDAAILAERKINNRLQFIANTGLYNRKIYQNDIFRKKNELSVTAGQSILCLLHDMPFAIDGIPGLGELHLLFQFLLQHLAFLQCRQVFTDDNTYEHSVCKWSAVY